MSTTITRHCDICGQLLAKGVPLITQLSIFIGGDGKRMDMQHYASLDYCSRPCALAGIGKLVDDMMTKGGM